MFWTELRLQQTGKNTKNIPCRYESHAWRWGRPHPCCHTCSGAFPPSVCLSSCLPLCPLQSTNQGTSASVYRHRYFGYLQSGRKLQSCQELCTGLNGKKNKNIPWSWVKAARLPQPLSCRRGAALAPLQPPAKIEPAGKIIN